MCFVQVLQSQVLNVGVPPQGVPLGPQLHLPPHLHHLYAPHPGAPLYPGPFWPHPTFVFHPGGAPTPVGRQVTPPHGERGFVCFFLDVPEILLVFLVLDLDIPEMFLRSSSPSHLRIFLLYPASLPRVL